MSDVSSVMATAATAVLGPAPIPAEWILSGRPEARNTLLATSRDRTTYIMVWSCTPGTFTWSYTEDETLVFTAGEAFIATANGDERRLGAGDMAFFPAGTSATWRVTSEVRKVAVVRYTLPGPVHVGLRAWNKLLRTVRPARKSPLTQGH